MNKEAANQWIVGQMNAQNISMRELGRRAGVAQSTISKVLSGDKQGSFDVYIKIAQVFNGVVEMLQVAGVLPPGKDIGDDLALGEIVKAVKALDPQERQELERYLDYLAHKSDNATRRG